jgi:glutathione S-transferase
MLKIHHLNNSRSQRIVWLAEELGLDYEIVHHQRDPETLRAPASLKAVHPLGKAPVIEHDGQLVAETGAIIEYITRKIAGGKLSVGPQSPEFGTYLEWLHFPESSVQGPLLFDLVYQWTGGGNEGLFGFYDAEIIRHHEYIETVLADRDYIVKSGFTAADVNLAWTLEMAEARGRTQAYPHTTAYLARMRQRPAYGRALERGGPQDLTVFGKK